jgi:uncharacterized OB-fold protein
MVRLDGADTPMLNALAADGPTSVSVGDRVRIRWAAETNGDLGDIECFEPIGDEGNH